LRKRVSKRGTLLKSGYSSVVGLSSMKIVADIGTDNVMLLITTSTGDERLRNVNIDDLE